MPSSALLIGLISTSCLSLAASGAYALPQGWVVSGGSASIEAAGPQLNVAQGTNRAVIDWSSFNVGVGEKVDIRQPNTSSILLNRIHDQQPSQIFGSLTANGRVVLANPNGMVFGPSSKVDVAGRVATASQIDASRFMQTGKLKGSPGAANAVIQNQGQITAAQGGLVAMVAPEVRNDGTIIAQAGKVQLSSGDTIAYDFYGDGLVSVAASPAQQQALVTNNGAIQSGTVLLSAAQAASLVDSTVNMNGVIEATGLTGSGGLVALTGDHLSVAGTIHADGTNGGTVNIGGNYQGHGPLPWAKTVSVTRDATLTANGQHDGGAVVLWSTERTDFAGTIHADAAGGGHGGLVETSSVQKLNVTGLASAASASGEAGTWLLDPGNITIADAGIDTNLDSSGAPTYQPNGGTDATIRDTTIAAALNGGSNVVLQTTGADSNITTTGSPNITYTGAGNRMLTLKASGNIDLNNLTLNAIGAGKLNAVLWSDSDINGAGYIALANSSFTTQGGDFTAGGSGANPAIGISGFETGINLYNTAITTTGGGISLRGKGFDGAGDYHNGVGIAGGSQLTTTSGTITLIGTGGNGTNHSNGIEINDGGTVVSTSSGIMNITGTGGLAATGNSNFGVFFVDALVRSTSSGAGLGTMTITGTGGAGTYTNFGIFFFDGSLTTNLSTVNANIVLNGTGGAGNDYGNLGMQMNGGRILSTGMGVNAGTITLNGYGGTAGNCCATGIQLYNGAIGSIDGNILLSGTGGSGSNIDGGIQINGGSTITSTGTTGTAATITLVGRAGPNGGNGVSIDDASTLLTSAYGAISLNGTGGSSGANNVGVQLDTAAKITSTGVGATAATITVSGTGGNAAGNNFGILLQGNGIVGGTAITTVDGAASLTGVGRGTGSSNAGIFLLNSASLASTGQGVLTLQGTGSLAGAGQYNIGVLLDSNASLTSVSGATTLTGTGGGGQYGWGVDLQAGAQLTSTGTGAGAAAIILNGTSGTGGDVNYGILVKNAGTVISSVDGAISLTGLSRGTTGWYNIGINLTDALITTGKGAISLIGTGANGNDYAWGVNLQTGAQLSSTGAGPGVGAITLAGVGGNGGANEYGILIKDVGTQIASGYGAISLTGTGGAGTDNNTGIGIQNSAVIASTGTGNNAANITLNGTGGAGSGQYNDGVGISDSGTQVQTVDGDIFIHGFGGTGTNDGRGVVIYNNATVRSTGVGANVGKITLNGTGGSTAGGGSPGIQNDGNAVGTSISSVDGDITLNGTATAGPTYGIILYNASGISVTGMGNLNLTGIGNGASDIAANFYIASAVNTLGNAGMTGNITINADSLDLTSLAALTQNNIVVKPRTPGTQINLGTGAVNAGLQLDNTELATLHADNDANNIGSLIIGDAVAGSGPVTATPYAGWNSNVTLQSATGSITFAAGAHNFGAHGLSVVTGGPIAVNGAITAGTDLLQTTGFGNDITLGGAGSIAASAAGNSLILASGRDFIDNNPGAASLSTPAGRWLVYSGSPSTDVFGGLVPVFQTYGCTYGGACPPLLAGHGALFRLALPSSGGNPPPLTPAPPFAGSNVPSVTPPPVIPAPPAPPGGTGGFGDAEQPAAPAAISLERATLSQTTALSNVATLEGQEAPTLDSPSAEADLAITTNVRNPEADSTAETISQSIHETRAAHNLISFTPEMLKILALR